VTGWLGPLQVGNSGLAPGSPTAVVEHRQGLLTVLAIDSNGLLAATTLTVSAAGVTVQDTEYLGNGNLVPGSPLTVVRHGNGFAALMVDRDGILNVATLPA
jgi:hypothetical protein